MTMKSNTQESRHLRYVEGEKSPFNAWWSVEQIVYPSTADKLQRGDALSVDGREGVVVGWTAEDDPILQDKVGFPAGTIPQGSQVKIVATRSEIGAHGQRLGYTGIEEVFDRS